MLGRELSCWEIVVGGWVGGGVCVCVCFVCGWCRPGGCFLGGGGGGGGGGVCVCVCLCVCVHACSCVCVCVRTRIILADSLYAMVVLTREQVCL